MKNDTEEKFINSLKIPIDSLQEISKDKVHGKYLTDSKITAVDFDKVKEKYCDSQGILKYPSSNDALYLYNDEWYFIEFKNGEIVDTNNGKNATVGEIREKINASLLVLFSMANTDFYICFPDFRSSIAYTCEKMTYILVYNDSKNRNPIKADRVSWDKQWKDNKFDIEKNYLSKNNKDILTPKEQKKYNKYGCEGYMCNCIKQGDFLSLISDIRSEISNGNSESAFDDILDILSEEADMTILRFGLDEYEGKYFNKVFTYTGDKFGEDGTVVSRGQFYINFVSKYEKEEQFCEGHFSNFVQHFILKK